MAQVTHTRHATDTLTAMSIAITQANESGTEVAVDLSGRTVTFRMVNSVGEEVVAETSTGVTVTDAVNGEVEYDFETAGVATYGVYYGYFNASSGGQPNTFPVVQKELKIILHRD